MPDFGPEGGEALSVFYQRAVSGVAAIAARHRGQHVAVVTHGGVLDALYRAAARVALDAPRTWQIGNASINRLLHGDHGFTLVGWGDCLHLESPSIDEVERLIGQPVAMIDTPALVIDLDAMERNLMAMAAFARERGLRLRPHAKMHKSAWISRRQIELGAVGVCVQKTSEAEALAAQGVDDIFISNEVIDPAKLARVAALARQVRLAIAVDSPLGIERLAAAIHAAGARLDVLIEIDVGQGRCGVAPREAGVLASALLTHGLRFAGLQAYQGRAQHLRAVADRRAAIDAGGCVA